MTDRREYNSLTNSSACQSGMISRSFFFTFGGNYSPPKERHSQKTSNKQPSTMSAKLFDWAHRLRTFGPTHSLHVNNRINGRAAPTSLIVSSTMDSLHVPRCRLRPLRSFGTARARSIFGGMSTRSTNAIVA